MKLRTHIKPLALGVLLMAGAAMPAWSANLPFVLNPSGLGVTPGTGDGILGNPAGSFTADTFNFFDNATITVQPDGTMTETGIFSTSTLLYLGNNVGGTITGVEQNYGIYGKFTATGTGGLATTLISLEFTLWVDPTNNTTFSADGSIVTIGAGAADFQIAHGSLIEGSASLVGPPFNLALQAKNTFVIDQPAAGDFFFSPDPFYINIGESFTAFGENTITTSGDCEGEVTSTCTVVITGGAGTAGFAVPEPATLALMGLGLLGLGTRRRRQS